MANAWIRLSRGDERTKVFFFPYSGGTAQVFRPFAELLGADTSVYALELPGRGRRFKDNLLGSIPEMVAEAADGIKPLLGGKFIFFGHSLGGLVSFELARMLRKEGLQGPGHLFVSGTRAPDVARREDDIHNLSDRVFTEKLREMEGTPSEILTNTEMLEIMLPMIRSDFKAFETYKFSPADPLDCPITAFCGNNDKFVIPDDCRKWANHTSGAFDSIILNGNHFFMHEQYRTITEKIKKALQLL